MPHNAKRGASRKLLVFMEPEIHATQSGHVLEARLSGSFLLFFFHLLSLTRSWRSSTTCWTQSLTSQESVFSTSSGASGFSYSESIPVKPLKDSRQQRGQKRKGLSHLHRSALRLTLPCHGVMVPKPLSRETSN